MAVLAADAAQTALRGSRLLPGAIRASACWLHSNPSKTQYADHGRCDAPRATACANARYRCDKRLTFWVSMAATGVSAILMQYAQALGILKPLGGAYLLFLAVKAGRSALTTDKRHGMQTAAARQITGFSLYKRGLLIHLTNPKALLGWIATMSSD